MCECAPRSLAWEQRCQGGRYVRSSLLYDARREIVSGMEGGSDDEV